MAKTETIHVDYLARVEGEGGINVVVEDGRITRLQLNIFEPPRFYEAFLQGRSYREVPDITARICGICPVAYQMGSVHAMERILGIDISPELRTLRRLLYCAEWIESHALHIYLLHAPDYLGYESAIAMAANPELKPVVEQGIRLKRIGNELLTVIGGRETHPVNPSVGGFYRAPRKAELTALLDELQWGLEASLETVRLVSSFAIPPFTTDYEFVAISHPDEYPFNEGRVVSTEGINLDMQEFRDFFKETQVEHCNSLHSYRVGNKSYHTGPMARLNINAEKLRPIAQQALARSKLKLPVYNPFESIVVRAIELVQCFEEAIDIIINYEPPVPGLIEAPARAGEASWITEAPRGMCFHHYELDSEGLVQAADIRAPTSQNYARMEDDLREFVPDVLDLPIEEATWRCEQLIRCYDPCISCSVHFLKLNIEYK